MHKLLKLFVNREGCGGCWYDEFSAIVNAGVCIYIVPTNAWELPNYLERKRCGASQHRRRPEIPSDTSVQAPRQGKREGVPSQGCNLLETSPGVLTSNSSKYELSVNFNAIFRDLGISGKLGRFPIYCILQIFWSNEQHMLIRKRTEMWFVTVRFLRYRCWPL